MNREGNTIPQPPKIDIFAITKSSASKITHDSKKSIFECDRENLYKEINAAAQKGMASIDFSFNEHCYSSDIGSLADELKSKGFTVEYKYGIRERLAVEWY